MEYENRNIGFGYKLNLKQTSAQKNVSRKVDVERKRKYE